MESIRTKNWQVSESLVLGGILSLSGGFMDAYTYTCRGQVFANAQTGNILLLGVHLSQGHWLLVFRYFLPVFAFALGIAVSDIVRHRHRAYAQTIHWRQVTILAEAFLLFAAGFIPRSFDLLANSLVSFACGIQVESFRKIYGHSIATTMCIGNLRAATESLIEYLFNQSEKSKKIASLFWGIIIIFVIGAIIGNFCVMFWGEKAILVSSLLMILGFILMFFQKEESIFRLNAKKEFL